jgi:hypothetical protein
MEYKFKCYEKIDGDEVIEYRLKNEEHTDKDIEEISEAQVEPNRVPEKETTIEGPLSQQRTASSDFEIIERQLDTKKGEFGNKYRNEAAYSGDINKLEEKRLLNDPVEDEKYKPASVTPEGLRWWEKGVKKDEVA